ncbi:YppG family protein [Thalassorhabdus alkalitolerans]|uniref:YppG family protein n=1 Tax=Thalassorhabdus alkalitolerans TaxID=2282697 RepID=A0ABW0YHQ9_9BACI|nr:YppG family protein [Thalassobacillus sp. C254]
MNRKLPYAEPPFPVQPHHPYSSPHTPRGQYHPYAMQQPYPFPGGAPLHGGPRRNSPLSAVMNGFVNDQGNLDLQKTMTTMNTVMQTVHQVQPLVRQMSELFIKRS